ncbi:MAG: motility protein A [Treponema sp. CETP13]|nr:MAG: motility protein A [Treponema sp. CETP13]
MDLASILGVAGGLASLIFAVATGPSGIGGLSGIFNIPSLVFVIFGSFCAILLSFPMHNVFKMFGVMGGIFHIPDYNENNLIQNMVALAEKARREGILALEEGLEDMTDPFMKTGLRLVVDGTDGTIIQAIMENEINQLEDRHLGWITMIIQWAGLGPSYGMMGTVIGLIGMLSNMEDTSSIGPNMAIALVTTLYGSLLANMFLVPISNKLTYHHKKEIKTREMVLEGVLSIQAGDNPRVLAMKLLTYLDPESRKTIEADVLKD